MFPCAPQSVTPPLSGIYNCALSSVESWQSLLPLINDNLSVHDWHVVTSNLLNKKGKQSMSSDQQSPEETHSESRHENALCPVQVTILILV